MHTTLAANDLVLIGAGHTNLHIVRMWRMDPIPGVQLTLVSPFSRATYSGMLPGTLAGLYRPEEMEIDLWRLSETCGVRLIIAEVVGFDPQTRRVKFSDRPEIRYNVAAIGIGSVPNAQELWRGRPELLSIKPMATFQSRLDRRLEAIIGKDAIRVAVVGAGAAGVEITFCLQSLLQAHGIDAKVSLIDSGDSVLAGYADKTVKLVMREFDSRRIEFCGPAVVSDYANGRLQFADGNSHDADLVIWATGASPPPVLEHFSLPKDDRGFLAVRPTLQSTEYDNVFVVGDTAGFVEQPLPKAGVYAVREGPVLWENLRRTFSDQPLERFQPQSGFLSLLATGDGKALFQYKGFAAHGGWAWKLKDRIDRKFMHMFQDYRPMPPEMMEERARKERAADGPPVMRCRGCGGKVGANVLSAALDRLEIPESPYTLQGLDSPDDAALLDPKAGTAEVLSVDFFQAFLDDPYLVGRVAALNSLSDLWAMGSEPIVAMAMVTLPTGPPRQQAELLYQLLAGGLREILAAGATLLGGHTTESAELTIGYTVIGQLNGRPPMTKANLQPGHRLILTKPLGTGTLLAAHTEAACRAEWMDAMFVSMLISNAEAARIARESAATALTDITGFGLAGHLLEMLDASGMEATLSLESLPLLTGFVELNRAGIQSSLAPANRETEDRLQVEPSDVAQTDQYSALFDPQTSGGLLIGTSEDKAADVVKSLKEAGYTRAAVIGEVTLPAKSPRLTVSR